MQLKDSTVVKVSPAYLPHHANSDGVKKKKILVVGLFLSEKNKHKILRSASDQLAELLDKYYCRTINVSTRVNQVIRFIDTVVKVIIHAASYRIAIVPLYGGFKSYVWQSATTRLLKLLGKKVILVVHGGSIPMRMRANGRKYVRTFNRADMVVCPSPFLGATLTEFNVRFSIIENVINLQDYKFQHKQKFRPRLLWMRTLEDIYNPEMAVRVAAILVKKYPDLKMVMAGYDKGSLALVKQLIDMYQLHNNIELPGYISNAQKNCYAEDLDIYICTNRIDNAPVSFIEMMALGLPIVTVSVGGIPYLITHGENGLLVPLDNDAEMADKISSIIEQPALGQKLASNGAAFCKKFDEQPVLDKWKKAFQQLEQP